MRVAFAEIGGVRTRYFYEGKGPALLLLHGLGISADCWVKNIDALAERFTVYAPDLLGHGFTGWNGLGGQAAHPVIMRHIVALTDRLGLKEYCALGSSYGAGIACLLYFERPERMKKLVIVGASSVFRPLDQQQEGFGKSYANATSALREPTWENCRKRLGNVCFDPQSVPDAAVLPQLTFYAQDYILPAYEEIAKANFDQQLTLPWRIVTRLEQIKLPTLVITGREDVRAPLAHAQAGQKRIPNSELQIFDKCGHMPMFEHTDKFNKAVVEFLTRP
jgi:pimeloyl-ACP methyl ester carboxylesterase